jgi:hypothetical protein
MKLTAGKYGQRLFIDWSEDMPHPQLVDTIGAINLSIT